jgi:NADH:ubiquinone oxidoreductase subunit F (NADH-binding)
MHSLEKRTLLPADLNPVTSLREYIAGGGLEGLKKACNMTQADVIRFVKNSGLRGRGGAGFPAGIKWQTVFEDDAPKKYVVANCAEGEPGTYKDRYLIAKNPYKLLEGMLIATYAIGATEAIIGIKAKFRPQVQRLKEAIAELEAANVVEKGIFRLALGPDDYLFGEEKALLEVIDGRGAMPRLFPPYMIGVGYTPTETNPTVVNNAETLSHLPGIFRHGIEWFRSLGCEDTPGTMIITLSGDVKRPGMYEVGLGLTLRQLLYDIGGGPATERPFKAVFSGVANAVATPEQFDTPLGFNSMRQAGIGLGSGGFMVYDQSRSMVQIAHLFSSFLAGSSCGQCLPCSMGTRVITEHLAKFKDHRAAKKDIDAIRIEAGRCTNQTRCFLPAQESKLITSILDKFAGEFDAAIKTSVSYAKDLILPKIDSFDEEQGRFVFEPSK